MKNRLLALLLFVSGCLAAWSQQHSEAFFTATQSATGASAVVARQKAVAHARNMLAAMVDGKIKNVTQSYVDHNTGTGISADEFMTETRMTARTVLQGVSVADESVVKEKNGRYTVYVTLQLRKSEVLDALCDKLSESEPTKASFRKDVFTDLWEE